MSAAPPGVEGAMMRSGRLAGDGENERGGKTTWCAHEDQ
jgi:hypothetical protein